MDDDPSTNAVCERPFSEPLDCPMHTLTSLLTLRVDLKSFVEIFNAGFRTCDCCQ